MADVNKKTKETRESAMVGQAETTTRGSSSMQGMSGQQGGQMRQATPGQRTSEEAGMDQMSMMLREAREEGETGTGRETGTRGGMEYTGTGTGRRLGAYEKGLCDRERGMSERERGMSERERGMSDRERAMYDRECAMTDRERSSAWGEGQSSTEGMSSGQSRTGRQSGSSQTGMNR